jgi:SAM-dependent methyltransferase
MSDAATDALCSQLADIVGDSPVRDVLVVGCGNGAEAAFLACFFHTKVIGVDLKGEFDPVAAADADLRVMDATDLEFDDDSFDLVYSFHALEHISDPERALAEMQRVLRPGGFYCVGTPNRHRVVGYIGSATSLQNKVRWNLQDFAMRLRGRFRNEYGAHAGFTSTELRDSCRRAFGEAEEVTDGYYRRRYDRGRAARMVEALISTHTSRFLFPCVYFAGRSRVEP